MNTSIYQLAPNELNEILVVLDTALKNHRQWFDKLHTAMLFKQSFPEDILNASAHTQCQFGKWYYGNVSESIRSFNEFSLLEDVHRNMHDYARELASSCQGGVKPSLENYQQFLNYQRELISLLSKLHDILIEHQQGYDALTGAINRKFISMLLENQFEASQRYKNKCSVAMFDADYFKKINDEHGHIAGDHVLKVLVTHLKESLRKSDGVGRYGGEEFLIILSETDQKTAFKIMDKCREALANKEIDVGGIKINVTASIGVSEMNSTDEDAWLAVKRADYALYKAKEAGRNQVAMGE